MAATSSPVVRTISRTQSDIADSLKVLWACNGQGPFPAPTNPTRLALSLIDLLHDPKTQSRRTEIGKVADRLAAEIRW